MKATFTERGNGFDLGVGSLVYDPIEGTLYRVTSLGNTISTHGPGAGNTIDGEVEPAGTDASEMTDQEWDELPTVGVMIDDQPPVYCADCGAYVGIGGGALCSDCHNPEPYA